MLDLATLPMDGLRSFCLANRIRTISLFGSALRDDFGTASDIDLLVEFEERAVPGLLGLARMERELGELLGRRVDLVTPGSLSPYFRDEAEVLRGARRLDTAA